MLDIVNKERRIVAGGSLMSADTRGLTKGIYNEKTGRIYVDGFGANRTDCVGYLAAVFLMAGAPHSCRIEELPRMPPGVL